MQKKKCSRCERSLPMTNFYRRSMVKDGRRSECKDCKRTDENQRRYGLPKDEFHRLYFQQRGRCAICGDPDKELHVDHRHSCGTVRGLLCQGCNVGIGQLKDDPDILTKAIAYLERTDNGDDKDNTN